MNVSLEEEHALESQLSDLRLSTLEAIARENCAQSQRMDRQLRDVQEQIHLLRQRSAKHLTCIEEKECHLLPDSGHVAPSGQGTTSLSAPEWDAEGADTHMCDYCFTFSVHCFACSHCGREWYCSDVCQQLRQRCHAARCRACSSRQLDRIATS